MIEISILKYTKTVDRIDEFLVILGGFAGCFVIRISVPTPPPRRRHRNYYANREDRSLRPPGRSGRGSRLATHG